MNKFMHGPAEPATIATLPANILHWLAGLLEGEGSFSTTWKKPKGKPLWPVVVISCKMTDEDVIRKIHNLTGLGNVSGPHLYKTTNFTSKKPVKPIWVWHLTRRDQVYQLCKQLFGLMGSRRQEQIRLVMKNYEESLSRRIGQDVHNHSTYCNRGCRCEVCCKANSDYWQALNAKRRGKNAIS